MKQLTKEQLEQVYKDHPEWLELPTGKWYKHVGGLPFVFKTGSKSGYGFNYYGCWDIDSGWTFDTHPKNWQEATKQEVEESLIAEAKRRGYKDGVSCYWSRENITHKNLHGDFVYIDNGKEQYLGIGDKLIFHDGEWAKIITPSSDIHTDIQALKDKYPDYNLTIIAEKKSTTPS